MHGEQEMAKRHATAASGRIRSRPLRGKTRQAALAALVTASVAAYAGPKPDLQDPVIIPETAVAVDHLRLIGNQKWTPLNQRMLLVRVGAKPHLLVFDSNCPRITQRGAVISTRTPDITLHARSDVIYVAPHGSNRFTSPNTGPNTQLDERTDLGGSCPIDRMYSVLEEDLPSLRKRLEDADAEPKKSD
jgi:hypothetical protein